MSSVIKYKSDTRQTRNLVARCLEAGLVPYVQSSPGMGKSAIMKNIAEQANLKLIDVRLSALAPEDIQGLPKFDAEGFPHFMPFTGMFPVKGTSLPSRLVDGVVTEYAGWLLFLDELPAASPAVIKAAYRLILDKQVGEHDLHEAVYIAAAGNLATDKALIGTIGTAMQSRVVHILMETNSQVWIEDVALPQKYDKRILAYISQYGSKLHNFDPNHKEETFACQRTWEFVNKLIKDVPDLSNPEMTTLLCGAIGPAIAVEFVQYTAVFNDVVKIEDILNDPLNTPLPVGRNLQWATVAAMTDAVDMKNFPQMAEYASRFDLAMLVLFFRAAVIRIPNIRTVPAFMKVGVKVSQYLNQK